ncbi:MAG: hypothetical protein IKI45_05165 [Oscillospiraceae bacterium]|nr:hypothetical protein [Oscillospiraceae bacterium]
MITSFVYDGHEIEVQNGITTANLVIDGQQFDSVKGVFKPEKDTLSGTISDPDGQTHAVGIQLVSDDGLVWKAKCYIDGKLHDVRYLI